MLKIKVLVLAVALFVAEVHQTSAQNGVEIVTNDGGSVTGSSGITGRKVRTLNIGEDGAQYSRHGGGRSNLDATLGTNGIQINRNGRSIMDGRTGNFDVNENGANLKLLQGSRASLDANAGNRNNFDYSRQVRQGSTADGSGTKQASFDLDNGKVNIVGRRTIAKANENAINVAKRVRHGTVADGSDNKRANVDLKTGEVNVVGRRSTITGKIGGTGEEALKIQRISRGPEERAQRRQELQERRERRRGGRRVAHEQNLGEKGS